MVMWMVYERVGMKRNREYVNLYREACLKYGIEVEEVSVGQARKRVAAGERPAFVLVRVIRPKLTRYLEKQGVPVFNSYHVSWICNDKGLTHQLVKDRVLAIPTLSFENSELKQILLMSREELCRLFQRKYEFSVYENKEKRMLRQAEDYVIKAVDGHGGKQVFSLEKDRDRIVKEMKKCRFVLQPMIRTGEISRDLRVYVVGKQIIAAVMRSSSTDFRANFSLGGNVSLHSLKRGEIMKAKQIINAFDFGMAGIDFIYDDSGQLIFNEIEDVVGARMLYQCAPDINIVEDYVRYIVQKKLHIV